MPLFTGSRVAIGVDVVTISRIQRLLNNHPNRFREFGFTTEEQSYCENQAFPPQHYAARWSVKEAFIKAVGQSDTNPDLTSIQIVSGPPPQLSLSDDALNILKMKEQEMISSDNTDITVTMTHEQEADLALGLVVILF